MAQEAVGLEGTAPIVHEWLERSPFARHLGMRLEELAADAAVLTLPFTDSLPTLGDVVHGGAISALADTAATAAAWSGAEAPENLRGTTVGMSIDFLAAARGQDLTARASVIRRGRTLCFCEVDVSADGHPVAKALVTYKLG